MMCEKRFETNWKKGWGNKQILCFPWMILTAIIWSWKTTTFSLFPPKLWSFIAMKLCKHGVLLGFFKRSHWSILGKPLIATRWPFSSWILAFVNTKKHINLVVSSFFPLLHCFVHGRQRRGQMPSLHRRPPLFWSGGLEDKVGAAEVERWKT